jgi:hypothetical protein
VTAPRFTERIFIRIDPRTLDKLRALAKDDGRSESDTVRRLVTAAFDSEADNHRTGVRGGVHKPDACPVCNLSQETTR